MKTERLSTGRTASRSGFTLLELLTVIVIIAILAGILMPVLGRTKDRAHELAAKDLCSQVVAAWKQLALDCGRLPSQALLNTWKNAADDPDWQGEDGNLVLPMSPGVLSVLNWWNSSSSPSPKTDVAKFSPRTTGGTVLTAGSMADPDLQLLEFWPPDERLERSFVQKAVGLYSPWAEREFKAKLEAMLSSDAENDLTSTDEKLSDLKEKWKRSRLYVVLDMDGDGILTLPDNVATLANVGLDENGKATIRGTAAAWTLSKDGKRLLTSW